MLVTGELSAGQEGAIAGIPGVTLVPAPLRPRRPAAVAALGWARFRSGDVDDPETLEPFYLGALRIYNPVRPAVVPASQKAGTEADGWGGLGELPGRGRQC